MSKPNVVFFMVDQLSQKWLEAADRGVCDLPNIRRLREGGASFTRAFSSNPVCCPARATLATGLSSRGHGVLENGYRLDPNLPTFMRTLQNAGWRTGAFGKVHLQPHFAGLYPDYTPYGFEVTHITEDDRGGEWLDWVEKNHPEHYEAVLATIWATSIPEFAEYGADKRNLRDRIRSIQEKFEWATPDFPDNNGGNYTLPFPEEVSQTNWITERALEFLRETPSDTPLYAHISYVQPHDPRCPPAKYLQRVNPEQIPPPLAAQWADDPHAPDELKQRTPSLPKKWRYHRLLYFADVAHLDAQLGRVLDALEQTERADNTYIIFLSDHGELLYDHGLQGKAEKHYDACIRVPMIIAGPGVKAGSACDELVQLEDICPTVLDVTGQSLPAAQKVSPYLPASAEKAEQLGGKSLVPLLQGRKVADWRTGAYCESYNNLESMDPSQWARTIRTRQFRYTFYPGGGEQMFDLEQDPDEQHNLVADPAHAEIRRELRGQLMELIVLQDYPKTRRDLFAFGVH